MRAINDGDCLPEPPPGAGPWQRSPGANRNGNAPLQCAVQIHSTTRGIEPRPTATEIEAISRKRRFENPEKFFSAPSRKKSLKKETDQICRLSEARDGKARGPVLATLQLCDPERLTIGLLSPLRMLREKLASICAHARAAQRVIHSWRRPRAQRFRPGSRL